MRITDDEIQRFLAKPVRVVNGCWIWPNATDRQGYGFFKARSREKIRAHRLSWEVHNRTLVPDDMCVLHSCDVPSCVNPAHLRVGTRADNMADVLARGRGNPARGARAGRAKLTELEVRAIRALCAAGVCQRRIAETFGTYSQNISRIAARKTWKHV